MTVEPWIPTHEELRDDPVLLSIIDRVICWMAGGGLVLISLVLMVQVFARYLFGSPTVWSEELAVSMFVWVSMLSIPLGLRRGEHLTLDFLIKRFGPRATKVSAVIIGALTVLTLAVIGYLALKLLGPADRQLLTGITNGLGVAAKVSWVYLAIPVGCGLSILFVVERLVLVLRGKVSVLNEDADKLLVEHLEMAEENGRGR